jgi:hypothetical protein
MMWRTVAVLSALWSVLVIAPAVVTTIFFTISADTPINGVIVAAWIVGFLLQFAVFLLVGRKSRRDSTLGTILASIMPFAADWSAPVSWWALVICATIVVGYAAWMTWVAYRADGLRRDGVPARAIVVEVNRPAFNVVINNVYIRRTLRLRIERSDGVAPYEARLKATFMLGEIPEPGATLPVVVDPVRPQHIELSDTKPTVQQHHSPVTRTPAGPPVPAREITEQLQKLTSMHRGGDLSDAEFVAAKKRLLGT